MHRIRAIFRRSTNCTGIEKPEILKFQTSQYKKEYPSAQDTLSSYQLKWLHQGSDRTHQDNQNDQRDTRYDKPGDRQAAGSSENSHEWKNQTQGPQYPAEPRNPAENQTQQGQNKTGGSQSVRASPLLLIDNDRLPFDLMSADFISILLRNIIHKI